MDSREKILEKLRAVLSPLSSAPSATERQHMVPMEDTSPETLQARFVHEAEALGCMVNCFSDSDRAADHVLRLIAPNQAVQSWDFEHIPLPNLMQALDEAGIRVALGDATVQVGLTGVDAALAGTGSLVLTTGPGKPRQPSLVPPVHIAILTTGQIVPNLEIWATSQRLKGFRDFRAASGIVVVSGPSRTGDIANIPVKGVHGPGTVHIVLLEQRK